MERTIETIKQEIARLFQNAPQVHVNVTMRHPKVNVRNAPAVIIDDGLDFLQGLIAFIFYIIGRYHPICNREISHNSNG